MLDNMTTGNIIGLVLLVLFGLFASLIVYTLIWASIKDLKAKWYNESMKNIGLRLNNLTYCLNEGDVGKYREFLDVISKRMMSGYFPSGDFTCNLVNRLVKDEVSEIVSIKRQSLEDGSPCPMPKCNGRIYEKRSCTCYQYDSECKHCRISLSCNKCNY